MALRGLITLDDKGVAMWEATIVSLPGSTVDTYSCVYSEPGFVSREFTVGTTFSDPAIVALRVLSEAVRLRDEPE